MMKAHRVLIRPLDKIIINNEAYLLKINVGTLLKKSIICDT